MKNTKSTSEILQQALDELQSMTSEEVRKRTSELGIKIPKETVCCGNDFQIDLHGSLPEAINSY